MKISVSSNIDEVMRGLEQSVLRQVPFATAKALTETAKSVRTALGKEIERVLDRPTPWIRKSPVMTPARKDSLVATVGIRDTGPRASPAKYLKEHFTGGARSNKPMELAMRSIGVLPPGWLAVPSSDGVKKDSYGNVSRATVVRILNELKTGGKRQSKNSTFRLFVVKPGESRAKVRHLAPGIWSVSKFGDQSVMKPVFFFVTSATYRKVIDLPRLANRIVQQEFRANFSRAIALALRTAR